MVGFTKRSCTMLHQEQDYSQKPKAEHSKTKGNSEIKYKLDPDP